MFTSPDEVASYIRDNDVEFVDVRFCDLPGVMQHFTIPAATFGEDTFSEGLGFDGSSIRGFQAINESDMLLLPDANSAFLDPFRKHKTLNVNFFIHDPITGEAYSRDPRNIARKALAYLDSTGIADTAYFAPEAEFYIFDNVRYSTGVNEGYYHIDSVEGWWNSGSEGGDNSPNLEVLDSVEIFRIKIIVFLLIIQQIYEKVDHDSTNEHCYTLEDQHIVIQLHLIIQ